MASPLPLPPLTTTPSRHPDCCLSLSTTLLDILAAELLSSLPPPPPPPPSSSPSPTAEESSSSSGSGDHPTTRAAPLALSVGSGTGLLEALLQARLSSSSPGRARPPGPSRPGLGVAGVEVRQPRPGAPPVNRYLPPRACGAVRGSFEVSPWLSRRRSGGRRRGRRAGTSPPGGRALLAPGREEEEDDVEEEGEEEGDDEGDGEEGGEEEGEETGGRRRDDVVALLFVYPRQPHLVDEYLALVAARSGGEGADADAAGGVRAIFWAGPRADWDVFEPCFRRHVVGSRAEAETDTAATAERGGRRGAGCLLEPRLVVGADAGLEDYEMLVVVDVKCKRPL